MSDRVSEINSVVESIVDVKLLTPFEQKEFWVEGRVSFFVEGLEQPLEFDAKIHPQYPFKSHDVESIMFSNRELIKYNHIMGDGSICIRTAHSINLSQKLIFDFDSVKDWIKKYYVNRESDSHYEHLIVPTINFMGIRHIYFFNKVAYAFKKKQFGYVEYSTFNEGRYKTEKISNNFLQTFYDQNRKLLIDVEWNSQMKSLKKSFGLFVFLNDAPSQNGRWVVSHWQDCEAFFSQDFLDFLHSVDKDCKGKILYMPLFVGYSISDEEIHWQVIMLEVGNFPTYGKKIQQQWITILDGNRIINWAMTRNCSYEYFFGRGRLSDKITNSKILIIGIGAIGSIVAKTLVRCGCKRVDLIDYDVKEPENVCRSEYSFATGVNNKIDDLADELYMTSPFFETDRRILIFSELFDLFLKSHLTDAQKKTDIEEYLNKFDIIIDCTADNDLLYVLSLLNITTTLLNLSISNHAKHLVCTFEQNRYDFAMTQYEKILKSDTEDLYNPTGCWSPTFKASYNDINVLVQFAIKHINLRFEQGLPLRNFVIETDDSDGLTIKLNEF